MQSYKIVFIRLLCSHRVRKMFAKSTLILTDTHYEGLQNITQL